MNEMYKKYVKELKTKKKKNQDGTYELQNPWAGKKSDEWYQDCWNKIVASGLEFDGKHITLNEHGVSYDYVAYKNKMLLTYPESKIDLELVYKDDIFTCEKQNGTVDYKHIITNPFSHTDNNILGGYCVIKNKRGEFLTLLSMQEIEKCKKVAKTTKIWNDWFPQMCKKTVIKNAVKFHFDDIYAQMEEEDNKNYDLDKTDSPELPEALKNAITAADCVETLNSIYKREYQNLASAALKAEFVSLCSNRKKELKK